MAVTKTTVDGILRANIFKDTAAANTAVNSARNQSCTLYSIDVNNSEAAENFAKLYDSLEPVEGTTEPEIIIGPLQDSQRTVVTIVGGHAFSNGISSLGSDSAGKAAGSSPSSMTINLVTD